MAHLYFWKTERLELPEAARPGRVLMDPGTAPGVSLFSGR